MFNKAEDKVQEAAGTLQEKTGELAGDHETQARGAVRKRTAQDSQAFQDVACMVKDHVEDNPFKAVSIAAGFGLVIGLLLGRR